MRDVTSLSRLTQNKLSNNHLDKISIYTGLGLFRSKCLPFGIASSLALWQQTTDHYFDDLSCIFCFVGDIMLAGKTQEEHNAGVSEVENLGLHIDGNDIHKTQENIMAIRKAKTL